MIRQLAEKKLREGLIMVEKKWYQKEVRKSTFL